MTNRLSQNVDLRPPLVETTSSSLGADGPTALYAVSLTLYKVPHDNRSREKERESAGNRLDIHFKSSERECSILKPKKRNIVGE